MVDPVETTVEFKVFEVHFLKQLSVYALHDHNHVEQAKVKKAMVQSLLPSVDTGHV